MKIGLISALSISLALLIVLSFIVLALDLNDELLKAFMIIIVSVISYTSSYISTQIYREKGVLQGLAIGAAISFVMILTTLFISKQITEFSIYKSVFSITSSMLGGVLGVNTRKTKV